LEFSKFKSHHFVFVIKDAIFLQTEIGIITVMAHIQAHLPHIRAQSLRQGFSLANAIDVVDIAVVQQRRLQLYNPMEKRMEWYPSQSVACFSHVHIKIAG